jgi:polyphenol oxidase|tara:strand:- start:236 stop:994 length:759 start_codon:yes stop_codon:yes gene_type:complete
MLKSKKLSKLKKISHAFFGKTGGASRGIYKSLNCGIGSADKKIYILKNLSIVKKKISHNSKKIILTHQIHSDKFNFIDKEYKIKKPLIGDALITNQKKTPIAVLTADCAPILLYDTKNNIIAAIHAGWKGAYKGIIKKVVKFFLKKNSAPKNIIASIGPCISVKNYEIKMDFKKKFLKKDKKNRLFFKKRKNKIYFNLSKYIKSELKKLKINNIEEIHKDTFNIKNNFFSARRSIGRNENDYGRNISVIMIN